MLVEAVDGSIGATVLKHISKGSQPHHLPKQWVLGSLPHLDSESLLSSWASSFSIVDTACMSSIVFRASSPLRWICWVVVLSIRLRVKGQTNTDRPSAVNFFLCEVQASHRSLLQRWTNPLVTSNWLMLNHSYIYLHKFNRDEINKNQL